MFPLVLSALAATGVGCEEDRCGDDGVERGFLEDSPPGSLCDFDELEFRPAALSFKLKASADSGAGGTGGSAGVATNAGAPGTPGGAAGTSAAGSGATGGAVGDAGSPVTTAAPEGQRQRVALTAVSHDGLPRDHAQVIVSTCSCSATTSPTQVTAPPLRLDAVNDACVPEPETTALRCRTGSLGVVEFDVGTTPATFAGNACVCAESGARKGRLWVNVDGPEVDGLRLSLGDGESIRLSPAHPQLSCAPNCDVTRSASAGVQLSIPDPESATGETAAFVGERIYAELRLVTLNAPAAADVWFGETSTCEGERSTQRRITFIGPSTQVVICTDAVGGSFSLQGWVTRPVATKVSSLPLTVDPEPLVAFGSQVALDAQDQGTLPLRITRCDGSDLPGDFAIAGTLEMQGFNASLDAPSIDLATKPSGVGLSVPDVSAPSRLEANFLGDNRKCSWDFQAAVVGGAGAGGSSNQSDAGAGGAGGGT